MNFTKNKQVKTTLVLLLFFVSAVGWMMQFPQGENANFDRSDPTNAPIQEEIIEDVKQSQLFTATPLAVNGNGTSLYVNESYKAVNSGHINGQNGGTIQSFNVTNVPDDMIGHYVNVSVDHLSFVKNIMIQNGSSNHIAGSANPSLAQPFTINTIGMSSKVYLTKVNVTLDDFPSGSLDMYIYNESGGNPDKNITKAFQLSGISSNEIEFEYEIPLVDRPVLEGATIYFVVLNYTGDEFYWRYNNDGIDFGKLQYWNSGIWNIPGGDLEFTSSVQVDVYDDCFASDYEMNATANGGTAVDLIDISNGSAYVEFINISPINGEINITINTNTTWDAQFNYAAFCYAVNPIGIQTDRVNFTSTPNGTTQWEVYFEDFRIDPPNNDSIFLTIPSYWEVDFIDTNPSGITVDNPILNGLFIELSPVIYNNITIIATENTTRFSSIDNGRIPLPELNGNDERIILSQPPFLLDWEQQSFTASATPYYDGNLTFYLFYPNGTLLNSSDNGFITQGTPENYGYTFDASDPRGDYKLVANYYNGTSASSLVTLVPYRYLIQVPDILSPLWDICVETGGIPVQDYCNRDDATPRNYYLNGTTYNVTLNFSVYQVSRHNMEFSTDRILYPACDDFALHFNARDMWYTAREFRIFITDGIDPIDNATMAGGSYDRYFNTIFKSETLYVSLYYPNNWTQITNFEKRDYPSWDNPVLVPYNYTINADGGGSADVFDDQDMEKSANFQVNEDLSTENTERIWDEPNDDLSSAFPLGSGDYYLQLNGTDTDCFIITANKDDILVITALFADARGDINLYLYDSSGTHIKNSTTENDNEVFEYELARGGTYILKINRTSMEQMYQDYRLIIAIQIPLNIPLDNGNDPLPIGIVLTWEQIILIAIIFIAVLIGIVIMYMVSRSKNSGGTASDKGFGALERATKKEDKLGDPNIEEKSQISQYFRDATSTHAVLAVHNEQGTCLSKAYWLLGKGLNEDLVTGFFSAIGSFDQELGNQLGKKTAEGGVKQFDWGDLSVTMIDGAHLRICILSDHRIGFVMKTRAIQLMKDYETKHLTDLKYFEGDVRKFGDFPAIVERELDTSLNHKSKIDVMRLIDAKELPKDVVNVFHNMNRLDEEFFPETIPAILMRELGMKEIDAFYTTYLSATYLVFKPIE